MSVADGVGSGNPFVAIGVALYRGFKGAGPRRFFGDAIDRVLAAQPQPQPQPQLPATIDNSPKRRRTPGGPGYRPASWQVSPLPQPFEWPTTDAEIADWERSAGVPSQSFVGPIPTIPDTLPQTLPTTVTGTAARVLGRILGLPFLIFTPSRTADDDTVPADYPYPQPLPQPQGPTRRPRVRVRTLPDTPSRPDVDYPYQPRFPDVFDIPRPTAPPATYVPPEPLPIPLPTSWPTPVMLPTPTPAPTPTPTSWPDWLPYLLPLALPRPTPVPRTPTTPGLPTVLPQVPGAPGDTVSPFRPPTPLTFAQPLGLPFAQPAPSDPCAQQRQRERKRKRKPRSVCYSGTYRERAKGLSKTRKREIPCR